MHNLLLLAAHSTETVSSGGKGMSIEWAIVIFLTLVGLAISLVPSGRTYEVKKPRED